MELVKDKASFIQFCSNIFDNLNDVPIELTPLEILADLENVPPKDYEVSVYLGYSLYFQLTKYLNVPTEIVKRGVITHLKNNCLGVMGVKNYDYASKNDRYSNFIHTKNYVVKHCPSHLDEKTEVVRVFYTNIGQKLSRLYELLNANKKPKNEAISDTVIDYINYVLLCAGYVRGIQ